MDGARGMFPDNFVKLKPAPANTPAVNLRSKSWCRQHLEVILHGESNLVAFFFFFFFFSLFFFLSFSCNPCDVL